jgi:phosphoribosylanthranilate isomerase
MALKTKVKVGKITNLSDARYCSGMSVDFLGFPISSAGLTLDLKNYREITGWVSGPAFVLEWKSEEIPHDFQEMIQPYNADYFEVSARQLEKIPPVKNRLMVNLKVEDWHSLRPVLNGHKDRIHCLILKSLEGDVINSPVVREIAQEFSVLLGFGITKKNLAALLTLPIAGFALEGTKEDKPGFKEYLALSEILEALEVPES